MGGLTRSGLGGPGVGSAKKKGKMGNQGCTDKKQVGRGELKMGRGPGMGCKIQDLTGEPRRWTV